MADQDTAAADGSLAAALMAADTPFVLTDPRRPDNPIIAANAAFCALSGYQPAELLGHNCRLLQCEKTDPAVVARLRAAIAARQPIELVLLNQRRNGERFWNRLMVAPIFDPCGEVLYFFASLLDVTKEESEAALRRQPGRRSAGEAIRSADEERLRESQRAAGAASWEWFPQAGKIHWSEGAEAVIGPRDPSDARPPPDFAAWLRLVHHTDRGWARAGADTIARDSGRFEYRVEHGGELRWLEAIGRVLARDPSGQVVRATGIIIDVTERKAAEARARQSEARFRAVAEATSIIVFVADAAGHNTYVSPQFTAFTGVPETSLLGDGWAKVVADDDRERAVAALRRAVATGTNYDIEYRLRRHDGVVRWFQAHSVPLRDVAAQQVTGWCGTVTDIEEQVRAREALARSRAELERLVTERTVALTEALEALQFEASERARAEDALRQAQKMEAIGQLTGGIAHDFNNLLTAISGSMELLETRLAQGRHGEANRYIEAARRSAERGGALVQRLLAFARRQSLDPGPVAADQLVREMFELVRHTVGPGITVVARLGAEGVKAFCDANQLEAALLNLAINARDAMPDGGTLTLATSVRHFDPAAPDHEPGALPGDYVEIAVIDTGCGMTPQVRERAFDPFFTTKPIGRGTGLGLSQTYGFVRQSGGAVLLDSAEETGTTVRLLLPRHAGADPEPAEHETAEPPPPAVGALVLVVEDETALRELLEETLLELGCRVLSAADGLAGLEIARATGHLDLLVSDVGLPGLNGRRLADAAREKHPDLPVLFITGYAGDTLDSPDASGLPAGMEVMGKPFRLSALTARLSRMIQGG